MAAPVVAVVASPQACSAASAMAAASAKAAAVFAMASTAHTRCRHPVRTASGSRACGCRSSSCSRPPSLAREMVQSRSTAHTRCRRPARTALESQACGYRSNSCRRHWPERGACRQVIRGGLLGCEDAFSRLGCLENEQREHGAAQHLAWFAETQRCSILLLSDSESRTYRKTRATPHAAQQVKILTQISCFSLKLMVVAHSFSPLLPSVTHTDARVPLGRSVGLGPGRCFDAAQCGSMNSKRPRPQRPCIAPSPTAPASSRGRRV